MYRIFKCEPNKLGYVKEINSNLEALQNEVGGYIQCLPLFDNVVLIVDEEGRLKNKEFSFYLPSYGDIVGDAFFIGTKDEDFISLTDEQIEILEKRF